MMIRNKASLCCAFVKCKTINWSVDALQGRTLHGRTQILQQMDTFCCNYCYVFSYFLANTQFLCRISSFLTIEIEALLQSLLETRYQTYTKTCFGCLSTTLPSLADPG